MIAKKRTPIKPAARKAAIGQELKTVALFGAGVVAGSLAGTLIDKTLKVDHSDTRMSLKKLIRPAALVGVGTIGSLKLADEAMKNMCRGVAASGILSGVKVILRKDFLNGLEGFEGVAGVDAFGEPIGTLSSVPLYYEAEAAPYLLQEAAATYQPYDPDLPDLSATPLAYAYEEGEDQPILEVYSSEVGEVSDFEII